MQVDELVLQPDDISASGVICSRLKPGDILISANEKKTMKIYLMIMGKQDLYIDPLIKVIELSPNWTPRRSSMVSESTIRDLFINKCYIGIIDGSARVQ